METTESKIDINNPDWKGGVRRTIDVEGHKWSYKEWGNPNADRQIIFIHGYGASAEGLDQFARSMVGNIPYSKGFIDFKKEEPGKAGEIEKIINSLDYHVIVPDLPSFGITEPDGSKTTQDYANKMVKFSKAAGLENPYVMGTSWGGKVAVMAAADPEMNARALICEQTMTREDELMGAATKSIKLVNKPVISDVLKFGKIGNTVMMGALLTSKDYWMSTPRNKKLIRDSIWRSHAKTAFPLLLEIPNDIGADIEKVKCPVVVIGAVDGEIIPILKSAESATRFQAEPTVFLPVKGGHGLVNDNPERVVALLDDVLSSIEINSRNRVDT